MATERFIRGKVDNCKHDGKASNMRRLEAAIAKSEEGEQIVWSMRVWAQRKTLPEELVTYHAEILRSYNLLPQMSYTGDDGTNRESQNFGDPQGFLETKPAEPGWEDVQPRIKQVGPNNDGGFQPANDASQTLIEGVVYTP